MDTYDVRTITERAEFRAGSGNDMDAARLDVITDALAAQLDAAGPPTDWTRVENALAAGLAQVLATRALCAEIAALREGTASALDAAATEIGSELEDLGKGQDQANRIADESCARLDDITGRIDSAIYHGESWWGRWRLRRGLRRFERIAARSPYGEVEDGEPVLPEAHCPPCAADAGLDAATALDAPGPYRCPVCSCEWSEADLSAMTDEQVHAQWRRVRGGVMTEQWFAARDEMRRRGLDTAAQ